MGSCLHCRKSKGKRSCPALGGPICPPCCGQHRLESIACPRDCQYLGGLAIVAETEPIGDFPHAAFDEAVQAIAAWERAAAEYESGREAFTRFFADVGAPDEADEWARALVIGYLYYGHRDARGRRMVDRFAEARGRDLGRDTATAVRSLRASWAALFDVEAVHRGAGLDLRDVLTDEKVKVSEVSGSYQLRAGEALFAWLMPVGDRVEMVGPSAIVPAQVRAEVVDELRASANRGRDRGADAPAVHRVLASAIARAPMPKLANTDGEDLVFCKAHYDVTDEVSARRALREVPGLDEDGEIFHWTGSTKMRGQVDNVSLGRIVLDGTTLTLEANSRARLERGKRLVEDQAGAWLKHRADSIQSVESALRELPDEDPPRSSVPPDVQAQLIGEFLRQHYASWPDVALPALDGKTPRQAAKTRRGRARVRALVDDIERGALRQPGGESVDFGALRESLGLDGETDAGYDPAHPPDQYEWQALDEDARLAAIEAHHRASAKHPPVPNERVHATVHLIVENQAALGQPAAVRETLERLQSAGLSRHEAVHAVGSVVAEGMWKVLREGQALDRDELVHRLRRLEPNAHRGSAS